MSIGKNTFYYTLALVFQKVLGFVFFAIVARVLGVEDTGLYVFALSFTTIFSVFADLGFAPVLIREIAKDKSRAQILFSQVFSAKIAMSLVTYVIVVLFVNILGYPQLTKSLVYIAGVVMVLDSFSLIFWAVFRGHQNLKYESAGIIVFQIITVGLGLTVLYMGFGVKALIISTLVGSTFFFFFSLFWLINNLGLKLRITYKKKDILRLFKLSFAFALAGVFARIYTQIDTVMISKLACDGIQSICNRQVGWYGVSSKIVLALQFIPMALSASLFPALSEQWKNNPDKLKGTYTIAWRYLTMIVLPVAGGVIILAPEIVNLVWGAEFLPAVLPLRILMGSLVFLFLTFPNGALLNASGNQLSNTGYMGIVVIINVVLNLYLISSVQMTGAAIASAISMFTLFALGITHSYRLIRFDRMYFLGIFARFSLASGAMIASVIYVKQSVDWWWSIPVAVIVYALFGVMSGGISKEDIIIAKRAFKR